MIQKKKLANFITVFAVILIALQGRAVGGEEKPGGTMVFIKPVRAVIFEHALHLDKDLSCDDCHPQLFAKKNGEAEKTGNFTMESLDQGKYCGACHDGRRAFSVNTRCTWCHIGVREHKRLEGNALGLGK
jgi:c(7)-type cytochrome triheme protein